MEPVNTLALVAGSVKRKLDEREIVEGLRGIGPQGIDSADEFGWTSLHYAAFMGHDMLIAALLRAGADHRMKTSANHKQVEVAFKKGSTALDIARRTHEKRARLAWRTLAILEAHEQGPVALAEEAERQRSALLVQHNGWAQTVVPVPGGRSPIKRESARTVSERRWYVLRDCRLMVYEDAPSGLSSPSGSRGKLEELDMWTVAKVTWLEAEDGIVLELTEAAQAEGQTTLTLRFDDEVATLGWLNAFADSCPRASRPEDLSPSARLSRLPPPELFLVSPPLVLAAGSERDSISGLPGGIRPELVDAVSPSLCSDGALWEVAAGTEAYAVATSRAISTRNVSHFSSGPFEQGGYLWRLRLTVDISANACGVHAILVRATDAINGDTDDAGDVYASFTLQILAEPALRDGNVASYRAENCPFQRGDGWGKLDLCTISDLEQARTLQVRMVEVRASTSPNLISELGLGVAENDSTSGGDGSTPPRMRAGRDGADGVAWGPELYSGWLRSRAQVRKNQWSERWFVARPGFVEYYTAPDDSVARAHIPLEGCEVSAVEEKGKPHCLRLVVASQLAASVKGLHGRYILECDSEAVQVCNQGQSLPAAISQTDLDHSACYH